MEEFTVWFRMVELIEAYKKRELDYSSLVNGLEGIMDARDTSNKQLLNAFYELWTPLEELNALYGNKAKIDEVTPILGNLEKFIEEQQQ